MKTMIKYLFFAIFALFTSCDVELVQGSRVCFSNKSTHVVMFTNIKGHGDYSEIVLKPNETITYNTMFGNASVREMPYETALSYAVSCSINKATIIFDDEFSIDSDMLLDDRKIDNIMNYTPQQLKDKSIWHFTYTFTDEDYEYAKKFGENLYEIE